ncbi:MAG: adenosylcobalamin-dependent ribonucleoside-diphosphate reductase [Gammaproteobacteria bacterium]|nr:adenosylcobalamin-dependent ribonucleoside-diphosphate reductase [Gammaproteobacteria bacterium]
MTDDYFTTPISHHIWDTKYRYRANNSIVDNTIVETWQRIAGALAGVESYEQSRWEEQFYNVLEGFKFLPGGRIQAGAGTQRQVTLFNCFVMGLIEDSMDSIFDHLKQGALTMQQGGGIGYDFSTLRPRGTPARTTGTIASGPVSFMRIWDSTCATLLSTGARRGAMMATLRCDHPDIEEFISAKKGGQELQNFNLSVQITDEFMKAIDRNDEWALVFPVDELGHDSAGRKTVLRRWTGSGSPVPCHILRHVRARSLWDEIMRATYDYAEPGVLFVDHINRSNNLWYCEHITATNPCGEIPLPPYGACNLGSINLTCFILEPFTTSARLDMDGISETTATATRMLDNVIDVSQFPFLEQAEQAQCSRRLGLGITGLGDALVMLGLHYGEQDARDLASDIMQTICYTAYRTSVSLADEKGPFSWFHRDNYLKGEFVRTLPSDIRDGIANYGIRNSHLTAIAPAGTISLLANNISSGVEPIYSLSHSRRILERDNTHRTYDLCDYAYDLWQQKQGAQAKLPRQFVDANRLSAIAHLDMQAVLQPYVDNAISKTINVPEDYAFAEFRDLYRLAYEKGLKGCATFRPNPITGAVLATAGEGRHAAHCCSVEREAD